MKTWEKWLLAIGIAAVLGNAGLHFAQSYYCIKRGGTPVSGMCLDIPTK